jgi:hypothetical protein
VNQCEKGKPGISTFLDFLKNIKKLKEGKIKLMCQILT